MAANRLPFLLLLLFFSFSISNSQPTLPEQQILLQIKEEFGNPPALTSIWNTSTPHCNWTGVECTNGSVTGIYFSSYNITEPIPSAICNLQSLAVLDLSYNYLPGTFPTVVYNCTKLQYLGISQNLFIGPIPPTVDRLSGQLYYLSLSANNFTGDIPSSIGRLSALQSLLLDNNLFDGTFPAELGNLSNLETLWLANNSFAPAKIHPEFGNMTSLSFLWMTATNLYGEIPQSFERLSNLEHLDLATNSLSGSIPAGIWMLKKLKSIYLFYNKLTGDINKTIGAQGLVGIDVSMNRLTGSIPAGFGKLQNLTVLFLYRNQLSGKIPAEIGQLSKLQNLSLSSNSFVGNLTEVHFSNLSDLYWLDLAYNHLEMIFSPSWIPPFNASFIDMCSCHMGPRFPAWLRTQTRLDSLCISEAGILENIPHWFWDIDITYLNVSYNQINGQLPPSLETRKYSSLDLSSNSFDGQIPNLDPTDLGHIDLSNNSFSGPIPLSLANPKNAQFFSLSNNHLNGSIPPFYFYNLTYLKILDLSNNNFSGSFSDSIGSLLSLQSLHLRNNSLMGNILWSLHHCQQLVVLDVGENRFSGTIPSWIGESLSSLRVLRLRSNSFSGNIPSQISFLTNLQVLDLAYNNLSGILSPSFWNFRAMVPTLKVEKPMSNYSSYQEKILLTTKGIEIMYTTVLSLVVSIDLSNNGLCGEINEELSKLHGLQFLNLSKNHLTGKIPENIGAMRQLQSLDLSVNNLSGNIPLSISNLNFLERLNLSQNNLSGRIPSGGQLQSLDDRSIYSGNLNLCGWPLLQCPVDGPSQGPSIGRGSKDVQGHGTDKIWLYASAAVGFIIGFWSVIGTLTIKVSLRISFFRIIDRFYDWVYVKLAISIAWIKSYGEV